MSTKLSHETYDYNFIDKKVLKIIKIAQNYILNETAENIESEIKKAYVFTKHAHAGQFRLSGEAYLNHPVEAVLILLELKPDIPTIQACLMHDIIEDTPFTYDDIKNNFSKEVADLCAGMEKVSKVRYKGEERTISSLRKMFVAMSEDIRVMFIKLSDRLHNMKTLKYHPKKDKRERIALETLNIYAPIADRLGLHSFKNRLDEECFKILNPQDYKKIKKQLNESKKTVKFFKENAYNEIDNLLKGLHINYEIDFRIKSIFSIFKKLQKKGFDSVNDLYDIYGIKILVNSVEDCYKVLGLVHNKWIPMPNRFKDYIALPKPNGYKSLHTTILGLLMAQNKQPTEIQIKTFKMDLSSEIGVAAHFDYKEKGSKISSDIHLVKELKDLTENLGNIDFMDSLKIDLFKDRIFVLSPKGDTINLPAGSNSIDFAYEIHTDLGNHIVLAKINGHVQPLDKELKNGDIVEIVTDKNKKPNPFHISVVKTAKAKSNIRAFLKNEDKDLHIERGRTILNNLLEKSGFEKLDKDLTILKIIDDRQFNQEERINLLEQLGNFSTNPNAIIKKIFKSKKINYKVKQKINTNDLINKEISEDNLKYNKNIIIGGEDNIEYTVGSCCEGRLLEKIVAYINSKGVITVHNRDCKTVFRLNKDRFLSAYYKGDELTNIIFDINFEFKNQIGVLKDLSEILFDMNINTLEINTTKKPNNNSLILDLKLELNDFDYLIIDRFLERIKFKLGNKIINYNIKNIIG
ncbi:MAG: RelA/SpoT family protein [Candidatus Gracilibacteria bacterium]|nr:RelA/SpoT family protein [Candidatus Gracilibacteria bacterium]